MSTITAALPPTVPRRRGPWCAITAARALVVVIAACATSAPPPARWPPPRAASSGPYHDPDHARGALPSEATRRAELASLRKNLDAMYAHRKAKLARYQLDEDALFAEAETRLVAATSWAAYDAAIYDALARFHDGHLTYHPPSTAAPSKGYTSFRLGLHTVLGEEHAGTAPLYVASVEPGTDVATAGVAPGDEVIQIDGKSTDRVLAQTAAGRASSRPRSSMTSFAKTWTAVLVPKGEAPRDRSVRVRRHADGKELAVAIKPKEAPKVKHEIAEVGGDADVAVVTIRSLEGGKKNAEAIDAALAKARGAKAIVLDLRGNRGGIDKVGFRVVADLAEGTALVAHYRVLVAPETIARRPMWKSLEGTGDAEGFSPVQDLTIKALDHGFKGKVAVVIDASCVSTCEVVASALRADVGAKLVGEITGGSSGAPVTVSLPTTRGTVAIPTWNLVSADGQVIEDEGVHPDVEVYATPDALAAGTDLPLQQAVGLVRAP